MGLLSEIQDLFVLEKGSYYIFQLGTRFSLDIETTKIAATANIFDGKSCDNFQWESAGISL